MSYAKKEGSATLLQGSSFTISLGKDDDSIWEANENGVFIMTDETNQEILNKPLVKSADNLTLTFQIDDTDSETLDGAYRILAWQRDSNDAGVNVPIADYAIEYETTKAG